MYWVWVKVFVNGKYECASRSARSYKRKWQAERAARAIWADHGCLHYETVVSETNPFKEVE